VALKSQGGPKRKPGAALANPANPLEVGTDRKALIGTKPELGPCRLGIWPTAFHAAKHWEFLRLPKLTLPKLIVRMVGDGQS